MHNKLYSNLKKIKKETTGFIKRNYKVLIIYAILIAIFIIPTKYEVYTPGSLLDVSKRIEVEDSKEITGSLNITYVKSRGDSIGMVLLSYVFPNWDLENKSELTLPKESYKESQKRYKLELENANQTAILLAYNEANKYVKIKDTKIIVSYVSNKSKADLKVGDELLEVDGIKINNVKVLQNYVRGKSIKDTVYIKIKRDKREKTIKTKLIKIDNKISVGVFLIEKHKLKTKPKVQIDYKYNESGSSAGLMSTLYIYNSLTPTDITKGLKVAGTGSINSDGKVIEIDGVKYKIAGAVKKKADVFIVPEKNYNEAIKLKQKNNYKIKIIKAITLKQVINELNNM